MPYSLPILNRIPPIWEIEHLGELYKKEACDGIIAMGGRQFNGCGEGGCREGHPSRPHVRVRKPCRRHGEKIKDILPPLICIPTTSGTGSEANTYSVITDTERGIKFIIMSEILVPKGGDHRSGRD